MRSEDDCMVTLYCIDSLLSTADVDIIMIDDGSPSIEWLNVLGKSTKAHCQQFFKASNTGFATTVNIGLRMAHREKRDAILVNADIFFNDDKWLEEFQKGTEYVRGAKLMYPHNIIQHAGVFYSLIARDFEHIYRFAPENLAKSFEHRICPVTGALQYITWDCLNEVGFYDENMAMSWEDVDYCLQVFNAGHKCEYLPGVTAIHYEAMFRGEKTDKVKMWEKASWDYLHEKWNGVGFSQWVPNLLTD